MEGIIKKYKLDEFWTIIEACEDEIFKYVQKHEIKENCDNINFMLRTIGKSFVTAREVITLCNAGFPDGALGLARNLFEQFITVAYIEGEDKTPEFNILLSKYYDDYYVQQAKLNQFKAKEIDNDSNEQDKQAAIIEKIGKKYGLKNKLGNYWWMNTKDKSFTDMCDYVVGKNGEMSRFIRNMHLIYKRACLALHVSDAGNRLRLGGDISNIETGPWPEGEEYALFLTSASLVFIIGYSFSLFEIKKEELIKELNNLVEYYYKYK